MEKVVLRAEFNVLASWDLCSSTDCLRDEVYNEMEDA